MSRNLTALMAAEIVKTTVRPIILYEFVTTSGTVYYWTGYGNLSWNSHTWVGTGTLLEVAPIDETDDVKAQGTTIRLSGMSTAMISVVLGQLTNGLAGIVRLAMRDSANAIIADPKIIFRGRLDGCQIDNKDPTALIINVAYEHELVDLERPRERRYTHEAQQALYPGDTALRYMAGLQDRVLYWGRGGTASAATSNVSVASALGIH